MAQAEIGIIGGSGLYKMPGLQAAREVRITTPFGRPSDAFVLGKVEGRRVAFLARHGRGHVLSPSELNFRANIYAMKKLGVERIMAVSAVGSLQEDLRPLDMVLPTQFFDRTRGRISTFFGGGLVAHVGFAEPVTVAQVIDCLNHNVENAQRIISKAVRDMPRERTCECGTALAHALITDRKKVSPQARKKLALLVGKYLR